jgi:pectinesterase
LPSGILATGWENWRNPENEKTARYAEFNNTGAGANSSERVKWAKILTAKEAAEYTIEKVMGDWKVK